MQRIVIAADAETINALLEQGWTVVPGSIHTAFKPVMFVRSPEHVKEYVPVASVVLEKADPGNGETPGAVTLSEEARRRIRETLWPLIQVDPDTIPDEYLTRWFEHLRRDLRLMLFDLGFSANEIDRRTK